MAKRALGMGIDALLGSGEESDDRRREVTRVPIDQIDPNPDQPRKHFDSGSLEDMAASIRSQGVLQPIIIEPAGSRYIIVAGERRFRAAGLAGLADIPVIVKKFTEEEKLEIALIENVQREDLNPVEEAEAYRQIMEKGGLSQADVADRVGKQRSTIANSLRLLKLPAEMKLALVDGSITAGHARALLAVEHPDRRKQLFDRIVKEGLSVREAEALADSMARPVSGARKAGKKGSVTDSLGPELRDIQEKMIETFGTKVGIRGNENRGKIEISYFSMEDLERICDIIERMK